MEVLVYIVVLIFSVMMHEIAHALCALWRGDDTAQKLGRITLNPIPHLDLFGSIILPALLLIAHSGFLFAWAKPVPINYSKFYTPKTDIPLVSLAGPAANIILSLLSAIAIKIILSFPEFAYGFGSGIMQVLAVMMQLNIILAIFNMIPLPPLDGSKVITIFMSERTTVRFLNLSPTICFLVLMVLLWTGILSKVIFPIILIVQNTIRTIIGF